MSRTEQMAMERIGLAGQPDLAEEIAKAVQLARDDAFVRALVADERRRPPPEALPVVQAPPGEGVVSGNDGAAHGGWTSCPSVDAWRPPGVAIADRMLDVADAVDRVDRVRRLSGGGGK